VTGVGALREMRDLRERLARAAAAMRVPPARVPEAVAQLIESRERLEKDLVTLQRSGLDVEATKLLNEAEVLGSARLVAADIGDADVNHLRALSDRIRATIGSGAVVLGARRNGQPAFVVSITKDLASSLDANKLVKEVAPIFGGQGGGRADNATAGGGQPEKLAEAIEKARVAVRERLNGGRDRR
jgi:alanyl-tRNA synthetase